MLLFFEHGENDVELPRAYQREKKDRVVPEGAAAYLLHDVRRSNATRIVAAGELIDDLASKLVSKYKGNARPCMRGR